MKKKTSQPLWSKTFTCSVHLLPPPCLAQNLVESLAAFTQPGSSQRWPPPCFLHWSVGGRANELQPASEHRFPPPCCVQRPSFFFSRAFSRHPTTLQTHCPLLPLCASSINSGVQNFPGLAQTMGIPAVQRHRDKQLHIFMPVIVDKVGFEPSTNKMGLNIRIHVS